MSEIIQTDLEKEWKEMKRLLTCQPNLSLEEQIEEMKKQPTIQETIKWNKQFYPWFKELNKCFGERTWEIVERKKKNGIS